MSTGVILVIVVAAVGLALVAAGVVAIALARSWSRALIAGHGRECRPVNVARVDEFLADQATFALTVERELAAPPVRVWQALLSPEGLTNGPLFRKVHYSPDPWGVGSLRLIEGALLAMEERAIICLPCRRMTFTATKCSIPLLTRSILQDYLLAPTRTGGTHLTWTVAGRTRALRYLPHPLAAALARPVLATSLQGLSHHLTP